MGNPRLLVLDEPTEGIQPSIILDIEAAIRQVVATMGVSVLLVEQHLHFVRQADIYYAMQQRWDCRFGGDERIESRYDPTLFGRVKLR